MPFMWRMVAAKGLVIGNRNKGSRLNVANPYALSYAGYNELFTGKPDYTIWRNERVVNRNRTILEYLNGLPSLNGKIGSIGSWSLFPYIFNKQRSRIHLDAAGTEDAVRHDTVTFNAARQYIRNHMPRVMHLGFGGTDEAGHQRNYGEYLTQAHLADSLIGELWQLVQAHPFYKDQTTFIITTDHGRGSSRANWHKHGFFIPGSAQTWLALIGNEVAPLGEHTRTEQLYSSQVAGTIGALLRVRHFGSRALPLSFFNTNKAGSSDALVGGP